MKKKTVTIEDLALMAQKEFEGLREFNKKTDKRLDRLEKNDRLILKRFRGNGLSYRI